MESGENNMFRKCKPSDAECSQGMIQSELYYQALAKAPAARKSADIFRFRGRPISLVQTDHARRVAPLAVATGR